MGKNRLQILGYTTLLCLSFTLGACDKVSPREKAPSTEAIPEQKLDGSAGEFRKDGPGGLFKNVKWYQYDMLTHIIWPHHDVFAIKTPTRTYLVQVQNYYADQALTPGTFKLAVRPLLSAATTAAVPQAGTPPAQTGAPVTSQNADYLLDGRGCGNPYTNPGFADCTKDPEQNVFTYLDLDSGKITKMNETDAAQNADWDIAVRGTDMKINSGPGLNGEVQGALAKRFDFYFDANGQANTSKLRQPDLKEQAIAGFNQLPPEAGYNFFLPEGIDRVVHESFWMSEDKAGRRTASGNRSWIIRSKDGQTLSKLQIPLIEDDQRGGGGFDSRIHVRYQLQKPGETTYATEVQELVLDLSTQNKLKTLCLRLAKLEVLECSNANGDWDLKFTAIHRLKQGKWDREWLVFTANGAIGPLTQAEATKY